MRRAIPSLLAALALGAAIPTPLHACDPWSPARRGCSTARQIEPGQQQEETFDGGWDYPRCVPVCTGNAECYPWRSANGHVLLFGSVNLGGPPRPGHQGMWDIYISQWDSLSQRWGEPINPGQSINTPGNERRPCCTAVCDTIYFDRDGDIYVSTREGATWTQAVALPPPVNTVAEDEHPAISADGRRLYFSSYRQGGHGGSDIWVAYRHGAVWDSVTNLGPTINTPNEETRPFESYDRQRLYFSNNHGEPRPGFSFGGSSDVYVSVWTGSDWGSAVPMAAPINNDLVACSPYETPDGREFWIGSEAWEGSQGDEDIWVSRKGPPVPSSGADGYGRWVKTGELAGALYVYDLKQGPSGIIYAATACADSVPTGRVFKTTDGGMTWMTCADLPGVMVVYCLVVREDTVYAGTYPYGDVFKSTNRGDSWVNTADLPEVTAVRAMVLLRNGELLVGTSPHNVTHRNRLFRSINGGASWDVAAVLPQLNPCKVLYETSTGAIFAGGWGIDCFGAILRRSTDNGATWDSLNVLYDVGKGAVEGFHEAHDGILYVACWIPSMDPDTGGGSICRSEDGGTTWERCADIRRGDGYHGGRMFSVTEDLFGTLYVGMQPAPDSVVFASSDGGESWHSAGGLDGAYECLCLLRASDGTIYAGTTPNGDVFAYHPVAVEERPDANIARPTTRLVSSYPNPFEAFTEITYDLASNGAVSLRIYTLTGELVRTLVEGSEDAGHHIASWDGCDDNGSRVASGLYFYQLESQGVLHTRKAFLIK